MAIEYQGLEFKTRLEAQWAAFFDLAGWKWWANPATVGNWRPDFKVSFNCSHSECPGEHTLLVAVLSVPVLGAFKGHPCLSHPYGVKNSAGTRVADAGAAFGDGPAVSQWEMAHGAGGGIENVLSWVHDANELWAKAGSMVS